MVHGAWCMVHGAWCSVECTVHGACQYAFRITVMQFVYFCELAGTGSCIYVYS
jgi:hypothetical protein